MSVEQNKETARRIFAALRVNDIEAVASSVTEDFATHAKGIPADSPRGPDSVRQRLGANRKDTPNSTFEILDLFGEGDRLAVRMAWKAPAGPDDDGAPRSGTNMEVWRFEDARLAEVWAVRES